MNVCTVHSFANIISILPFFTPIFFSQGLSNDSRPSRSDTKANARKNRAGGNNKNQGGQSRPKAGPGAPLPAVPGKYLHTLLFKCHYCLSYDTSKLAVIEFQTEIQIRNEKVVCSYEFLENSNWRNHMPLEF